MTSIALLLSMLAGAAEMSAITDTIDIKEWVVAGPFPVGTREGITGTVEDPAQFRPIAGESLRSGLVQGGLAANRQVRTDSMGWLSTDYPDVRWDSILDYYGTAGLTCMGYAYAEFTVPRACRALALTPKLSGFFLNGLGYPADVYGVGWFRVPVMLDSGLNRVLLVLSGYGDQRVRFRLAPIASPVLIPVQDVTAPDLVADSAYTGWVGIPAVNATGERIDGLSLRLTDPAGALVAETAGVSLPAFGSKKVPLTIALPGLKFDSAGVRLRLRVEARGETVSAETLRLRIRPPDEPRKVTFISGIDGSCQYYGLLRPKDFDPGRTYALILSVHGAGVEAIGQAAAYRPKDWAFVVAPTNRRPYGFNHQDWGRLDDLEALEIALRDYPIDPDRVMLTGHSMGGHGVWHLATLHPDRFAAAAPEAGWPSIQLYVPWFLQRSNNFADPVKLAIRDAVLRSDNPPALLINTLNLPVFILHGGDDDNVPALHGRNFAGWLDELGYDYRYKEVPGRRHWWDYESLKVSVLDDPDLMAFLKEQQRNPWPEQIRFRTPDLGVTNRSYWAVIERVGTLGRDAEIEARLTDSLVAVTTTNVRALTLRLRGRGSPFSGAALRIDGLRLRVEPAESVVRLWFESNQWRKGGRPPGGISKTPAQYGPAKQVMMRPFALVYGTQDPGLTALLRHSAVQEANRWWVNANGLAEVLPDSEVAPEVIARCNLVLYGGPAENSVMRRVARRLPVQIVDGRMKLGEKILGESLAATLAYPNPLNPERLVFVRMGTDSAAARLALFWGIAGPSSGVPDFMVFDRTVRRCGWAGVRAAGFLDPDWKLDPLSMCLQSM